MSRNIARIWVLLFVIICIVSTFIVNKIPRGNFLTGSIIILWVYFPLGIAQLYLLIKVWTADKNTHKALKRSFFVSLIITLIFIYFLFDYILNTT